MQAIRTRFYGPTDNKGSRIRATCEAGAITVQYDDALSADGNHRSAACGLALKMGWAWQHHAGQFHGDYYWVDDNGLLKALRKLVRTFQDGTYYESKNPYLREEVVQALIAISNASGFEGEPQDSNGLEHAA